MIDEYVNKGKVVTLTAWAVVVVLLVAGWATIIWAPEHKAVGGMFAATACAVSAYAAVLHIRCYAVRLACLVRAMPSVEGVQGPSPVRGL